MKPRTSPTAALVADVSQSAPTPGPRLPANLTKPHQSSGSLLSRDQDRCYRCQRRRSYSGSDPFRVSESSLESRPLLLKSSRTATGALTVSQSTTRESIGGIHKRKLRAQERAPIGTKESPFHRNIYRPENFQPVVAGRPLHATIYKRDPLSNRAYVDSQSRSSWAIQSAGTVAQMVSPL
ncbi:hypothetical protein BJY00DRAFT_266221 [Aspergillus carlsbadensis]|nr:hypothetical protein BJY00DRAFT_266221 [Aspergillus carlsbadensis]